MSCHCSHARIVFFASIWLVFTCTYVFYIKIYPRIWMRFIRGLNTDLNMILDHLIRTRSEVTWPKILTNLKNSISQNSKKIHVFIVACEIVENGVTQRIHSTWRWDKLVGICICIRLKWRVNRCYKGQQKVRLMSIDRLIWSYFIACLNHCWTARMFKNLFEVHTLNLRLVCCGHHHLWTIPLNFVASKLKYSSRILSWYQQYSIEWTGEW